MEFISRHSPPEVSSNLRDENNSAYTQEIRNRLVDELEVYQAELELQNRQLRESQELLEESNGRYAELYDFAPVAYFTLDLQGCVVEVNLTGAALLGSDRSRLIRKPFFRFISPKDRWMFECHLLDCANSSSEVRIDLSLSLPNQSPIVELVSISILDKVGGVVGFRVALTDISKRKAAEDALKLSLRMREDFLAIVSHDLRNPLNIIVMGVECLMAAAPQDENQMKRLACVLRSARRMNRLLGDLLDLSSMDAGHLSVEPSHQNVCALVAAAIDTFASIAFEKGITLKAEIRNSDMNVYCDKERILQVLTNLVSNAIKFTPTGGTVTLEVDRAVGESIMFEVRDTGAGISDAQLTRIFEPYWQAPKTARAGTGLGLSICKGIVDIHCGKMWATSVLGKGSSFFFTLPIEPSEVQDSQMISGVRPLMRAVESAPARYTEIAPILVIDDEEDSRYLISGRLAMEGYEVVVAGNGEEALRYLGRAAVLPTLILLDLMMPVMNGWEFLERIHKDPHLSKIPIILISGQVVARENAGLWRLAGFVEKPIKLDILVQSVQKHRHAS